MRLMSPNTRRHICRFILVEDIDRFRLLQAVMIAPVDLEIRFRFDAWCVDLRAACAPMSLARFARPSIFSAFEYFY